MPAMIARITRPRSCCHRPLQRVFLAAKHVLIIFSILLAAHRPVQASPPPFEAPQDMPIVRSDLWSTNGNVLAMQQVQNTIYIAGNFTA